MPAPDFLDTNVLVYAYDSGSPAKRVAAQELLHRALRTRFIVSVQVLAELSTTLLNKMSRPASPQEVLTILDALAPLRVVSPDAALVRRAVEAHATYGIHFYDGMIVAAAERSGCNRIWSEDMNPGQKYFGIPVENPFK